MRRIYILLTIFILSTTCIFAQKKEKVKGSKFVTVTQHEIDEFNSLEILDDVEVYIIAGLKPQIEIEADDNLHEILNKSVSGGKLTLSTNKQATSEKKFIIRVTYTKNLNLIEVRNDAQLNSLLDLDVENISIKNYDYSKSFLNVNTPTFGLILSDKSKAELNLKSQNTTIEVNKNANLKALITSTNLKLDLYQKAKAEIEGDISKGKIRLDSDSNLIANNTTIVNLEINTEGSARASVNVRESIVISASDKSQIDIYGAPSYNLKKFSEKASLFKK